MEYILKILNKEIGKREIKAKKNYKYLCHLENEVNRLYKENRMLREDLQELSKEHFKK
jgi:hypothetical protein